MFQVVVQPGRKDVLQEFKNGVWVDVPRKAVYGPYKTPLVFA